MNEWILKILELKLVDKIHYGVDHDTARTAVNTALTCPIRVEGHFDYKKMTMSLVYIGTDVFSHVDPAVLERITDILSVMFNRDDFRVTTGIGFDTDHAMFEAMVSASGTSMQLLDAGVVVPCASSQMFRTYFFRVDEEYIYTESFAVPDVPLSAPCRIEHGPRRLVLVEDTDEDIPACTVVAEEILSKSEDRPLDVIFRDFARRNRDNYVVRPENTSYYICLVDGFEILSVDWM